MEIGLLKAIRAVDLMDSSKYRQEFFEYYVSQHFVARIVLFGYSLIRRTYLSALIFAIFGVRVFIINAFRQSKRLNILAVTDYINEQRVIEGLLKRIDDSFLPDDLKIKRSVIFKVLSDPCDCVGTFLRVVRVLQRYEKQATFLTACRVAEAIFYYLRAELEISKRRPRAVAIASNYSPATVGLKAQAERFGIPSIFSTHGMVSVLGSFPKLDVSLACLYGPSAIDKFRSHGEPKFQKVIFSGLSGESEPLRVPSEFVEIKTVGIFLSAYTIAESFQELIQSLSSINSISEILVRKHPLPEANPDLSFLKKFPKVVFDFSPSPSLAAKKCQLVIAGTSCVHIDTLKAGTISLYWEQFDTVGPDYYQFIQDRFVYQISNPDSIPWSEIKDFYNAEWVERFQYLDYSYLKDLTMIDRELQQAIEEIV